MHTDIFIDIIMLISLKVSCQLLRMKLKNNILVLCDMTA